MEYLASTIEFAIRNAFKDNLSLRQSLPIGFFRHNNFEGYLQKSLENLKINPDDCHPIELIRDFMSSRLPPYKTNKNEDDSLQHLVNIQKLDENLKIRLRHREHVCIAVQSENFEESLDEKELEDDEEDENLNEKPEENSEYKLLIFYSSKNLRKQHMIAKNLEADNSEIGRAHV